MAAIRATGLADDRAFVNDTTSGSAANPCDATISVAVANVQTVNFIRATKGAVRAVRKCITSSSTRVFVLLSSATSLKCQALDKLLGGDPILRLIVFDIGREGVDELRLQSFD